MKAGEGISGASPLPPRAQQVGPAALLQQGTLKRCDITSQGAHLGRADSPELGWVPTPAPLCHRKPRALKGQEVPGFTQS